MAVGRWMLTFPTKPHPTFTFSLSTALTSVFATALFFGIFWHNGNTQSRLLETYYLIKLQRVVRWSYIVGVPHISNTPSKAHIFQKNSFLLNDGSNIRCRFGTSKLFRYFFQILTFDRNIDVHFSRIQNYHIGIRCTPIFVYSVELSLKLRYLRNDLTNIRPYIFCR